MTIGRELEALLGERWSGDIPAQPLEPSAISGRDRGRGVDVDAADIGEGFAWPVHPGPRLDELARAQAGLFTQELTVTKRGGVARREYGVLSSELVGSVIELLERAAMTLEDSSKTLVSPARDLGDLLGGPRSSVGSRLAVVTTSARASSSPRSRR